MIIIPVSKPDHYDQIYRLTHDAFVAEGYIKKQQSGLFKHYDQWDFIPQTVVLAAFEHNEIIGTLSTTIDGPLGLNVDLDYLPIIDDIRSEGKKMASSWRMVTRKDHRNNRKLAFDLFQATFNTYIENNVETVLYTFNPRHERIYGALFNLKTVAYNNGSVKGLSNAPSILMRMNVQECPERWFRGSISNFNGNTQLQEIK